MGYIEEIRQLVGHRPLILVGSVVIIESGGKVLFQKRNETNERWGLIGGLMEIGESAEETARREAFEETGLHVGNLRLVGVFSGADYFIRAQNGDEFFAVNIVYATNDFYGNLTINDHESLALRFFRPEELPGNIAKSHRTIFEHYKTHFID
ncbi:NUDIX hydrolase [Alicyclobacillus fodiniaquatilis]|uniref:NUDIX hydrolase n=1 Tax=Alicyclobacillus fodiniaquatilis TaxID=1661150 RepID=A0ABW4JFE3_9BACL